LEWVVADLPSGTVTFLFTDIEGEYRALRAGIIMPKESGLPS